jgi:hypothetical protein
MVPASKIARSMRPGMRAPCMSQIARANHTLRQYARPQKTSAVMSAPMRSQSRIGPRVSGSNPCRQTAKTPASYRMPTCR